jgi:hypothetical protein
MFYFLSVCLSNILFSFRFFFKKKLFFVNLLFVFNISCFSCSLTFVFFILFFLSFSMVLYFFFSFVNHRFDASCCFVPFATQDDKVGQGFAGPRTYLLAPKPGRGRTTERDVELQHGGPGVYNPDYRLKHFVYVGRGGVGFCVSVLGSGWRGGGGVIVLYVTIYVY